MSRISGENESYVLYEILHQQIKTSNRWYYAFLIELTMFFIYACTH